MTNLKNFGHGTVTDILIFEGSTDTLTKKTFKTYGKKFIVRLGSVQLLL